ncbi:uncharacterized protein LOC106090286 [Stomoxys calcitrans]|uniref:uncharacterized protein LOC106090286 n=1 Tax=Stomoxys calcitrans TaxID=35570 RepID=UPI0027E348CA|nr:uncharacterized protein LOC106090286 [Stomoxys calcitrans]
MKVFHMNLIAFIYSLLCIRLVWMLPTKDLKDYQSNGNATTLSRNLSDNHKAPNNISTIPDALASSTVHRRTNRPQLTTLKPQGFRSPAEQSSSRRLDTLSPAAQNYFSTFFQPSIPPLGHSRPFYQATEEPFFRKFLQQQHQKHFLPQSRQQTYQTYDASILGSGDFGILRGGTFYSEEDQSYHQEANGEIYYSEASNSHSGPATEGFIQKYTYPEEQFEHFRDFADLNTPSEADFSQYVVVYAAKNATDSEDIVKGPKNIFEQLQQIDEEKAEEERHRKKSRHSEFSKKKLKLVKTKIIKNKWNPKREKITEEDPLLALS